MDDKWEYIGSSTKRLKVFKGWIIRTVLYGVTAAGGGAGVSIIFMEDARHEWELT